MPTSERAVSKENSATFGGIAVALFLTLLLYFWFKVELEFAVPVSVGMGALVGLAVYSKG